MLEILHREWVYLWYYFTLQLSQIFRYWVLGMVLGSVISVFAKEHIHGLFRSLQGRRLGMLGIFLQARWALLRRCVCTAQSLWPRPSLTAEWRTIGWRHL